MGIDIKVEEIDMGWRAIKREVKKFENAATYVGYFSSGVGGPATNVAARAMVMETGAVVKRGDKHIKIPAARFMRKTWTANKEKSRERIIIEYDKVLAGRQKAKRAISRVGAWYVGRTKVMVLTGKYPRLSPRTVARKGSSKRLIDTGEMYRATTHREKIR